MDSDGDCAIPGEVGDNPATDESDGVLADGEIPLVFAPSAPEPHIFPTNLSTDKPFLCPFDAPDPLEQSEPELFLLSFALGEAESALMGGGT